MIRAVFLDWFSTLARFNPPRHRIFIQVFAELGVDIPVEKAIRGILLSDEHLYTENMRLPIAQRSPAEQEELYMTFPRLILAEAGLPQVPAETLHHVRERVKALYKGNTFMLYEDVIPALESFKRRGLVLGIVANLKDDLPRIVRELGIEGYFRFVLTSLMVGAGKPDPRIFQEALRRAGVEAGEAVHVGDQYRLDIAGARASGIRAILIDRFDLYPEMKDCPRIRGLAELEAYL